MAYGRGKGPKLGGARKGGGFKLHSDMDKAQLKKGIAKKAGKASHKSV